MALRISCAKLQTGLCVSFSAVANALQAGSLLSNISTSASLRDNISARFLKLPSSHKALFSLIISAAFWRTFQSAKNLFLLSHLTKKASAEQLHAVKISNGIIAGAQKSAAATVATAPTKNAKPKSNTATMLLQLTRNSSFVIELSLSAELRERGG
jgi:hypothetical protein